MNAPLDMTRFIEAKSDQIGGDDLIGGPRTFTIRGVTANDGDQPVNVWLQGEDRVFRPCKTIRRVMVAVWGADASKYAGRSLTLYRDAEVQFGGMKVGGLRISHMSHMDAEQLVVVMKSKGKKAGMKILPLRASAPTATPAADDSTGGNPNAGADAGAAPQDSQADEWAEWAMGAIAGIARSDRETLAKWQAKRAPQLAELQAANAKLHGDVMQAIADRNAALDRQP
jgi:hypothetical protein